MSLDATIEKLDFVGPKNAPRLKRMGIKTVRDLFWHFPFRYQDFSQIKKICEIKNPGEIVSIQGEVAEIKSVRIWKRRMAITTAWVFDNSGSLRVVWFNQPYLQQTLAPGSQVSLSGKIAKDKSGIYLSSPTYEKMSFDKELVHTGKLVAVYPETKGVSSKYLRFLIQKILTQLEPITETLPGNILKKYDLPAINLALYWIHSPIDLSQTQKARQRFAFEELFLLQLRSLLGRQQLKTLKSPTIAFDEKLIAEFVKGLSFELTKDQKIAAFEILKDLEKPHPMNRLLNGDVGSGKTVVALIAAYQTVSTRLPDGQAGYQVAFMAPTEILAQQHYQTTLNLLKGKNISIELLTASVKNKKSIIKKIKSGEVNITIGTHALIQKDVDFPKLGLVIVDEQHRFGVQQRMKLTKNKSLSPHFLSMTATPIPRTLALTIYGDLDVSLLKEKPKNRQEIITKIVSHSARETAYQFIDDQIDRGRQVFVICPRIQVAGVNGDQTEGPEKKASAQKLLWAEVKAVTQEHQRLENEIFSHRRVAMLHGKMKAKEKEEIMEKFKGGNNDILVSTSVVEVGVDIANAVIMMIESAERFGLAQLHQFRGRVGRGHYQSYCFLLTSSENTPAGRRLRALEKTNNGFELAEMDLKIRGPGEFIGNQQSGLPDLVMASLNDIELIKRSRFEAAEILKVDSDLSQHKQLRIKLSEMQKIVHFE